MELLGIQILAILFALFMLYVNFVFYRKDKVSSGGFFLWSTLWLGFITFTLFPSLLQPIIEPLNVVRVLDLLMLVAFAILTAFTFSNYIKNREIEKRIEEIVRNKALRGIVKIRKVKK